MMCCTLCAIRLGYSLPCHVHVPSYLCALIVVFYVCFLLTPMGEPLVLHFYIVISMCQLPSPSYPCIHPLMQEQPDQCLYYLGISAQHSSQYSPQLYVCNVTKIASSFACARQCRLQGSQNSPQLHVSQGSLSSAMCW